MALGFSRPLSNEERIISSFEKTPAIPKPETLYLIHSDSWKTSILYNGNHLKNTGSWTSEEYALQEANELKDKLLVELPLLIQVMKITHEFPAKKVSREWCGESRDEYEAVQYCDVIRCEVIWDSAGTYPRDIRERCPNPDCRLHPRDIPPGPPFKCPDCGTTWGVEES